MCSIESIVRGAAQTFLYPKLDMRRYTVRRRWPVTVGRNHLAVVCHFDHLVFYSDEVGSLQGEDLQELMR